MKPRHGVRNLFWTFAAFDQAVGFHFWKACRRVAAAADRNRAERRLAQERETSPYQSPLTLACPCVWARSPTDFGKYNLVLGWLFFVAHLHADLPFYILHSYMLR